MTWVITDAEGEEQEILEDESVLVLACNQPCARTWMRDQGLPPYARQFKAMPEPRALEGYRPQTIVVLRCYEPNDHVQLKRVLEHNIVKSSRGVRFIDGAHS